MDFAEQLKSQLDIVNVIGDYVRLRRLGATGRYTGLCPFHQEKTPSFNVHQARQFYKCFGCGVGGDVFKFVMEIEGITFPEALKQLAESNGIPMPKRSEYADADSRLRSALMDMHAIAARLYQSNLQGSQGGEARAYLAKRGVSPEMLAAFELGFSDSAGLAKKLTEQGFSAELQEESGLVRKRQEGSGSYDFFRGRLMFPIHNESGKVIAFGGRAMRDEDQPKYLNSSDSPIYKKKSVLYNLHRARDAMRTSSRAVMVEGYMDVIGVYSAGIKEVVATSGTALDPLQVRVIHRYVKQIGGDAHTDSVVLNFDPDSAGLKAAEKAIQLLLDEGLNVRVLTLGDGGSGNGAKLDPFEYVKQFGAESYREKLEAASGYFHWLADRARTRFDMKSAEGKMDAFEKVLLPAIQRVSDRLERAAIAGDVASYLGVDRGLVLERFRKEGTDRRGTAPRPAPQSTLPAVERMLLTAFFSSESARSQFLPMLGPAMTESFVSCEIFEALRQVTGDGTEFQFAALEGRLTPPAQKLLHEALAADHTEEAAGDESVWCAQAEACLRRLEFDFLKRRIDDRRAKVKMAEREGRWNEAFELMTELNELERAARGADSGPNN